MVFAANPLPPGCPDGWPIKLTAQSGVQIVWGPPHSRQPPGHTRLRGIGIKMRPVDVPGYPEHSESWAGLYEQKLHELYWRFRVFSQPDAAMVAMVLHLPMMGMPPREPTMELMQEVRAGRKFSSFFKFATVIKATDIDNLDAAHEIIINETRGPSNGDGDDVVIRLPLWPKAPRLEASLYRTTMDIFGFEFRTHLPAYDTSHDSRNVDISRLYFIQLLPNELPSYHFWASPTDTPWLLTDNRKHVYAVGSPHYDDACASFKQRMRSSPQNSRAGSTSTRPTGSNTGSKAGTKRQRSGNSSSDSGSAPAIKKPKTKTPKPRAKGKGKATAATKSSKRKRR